MNLVQHDGITTTITLSERNITELYENLHNPDFLGLSKLQTSDDPALDARFIQVRVER